MRANVFVVRATGAGPMLVSLSTNGMELVSRRTLIILYHARGLALWEKMSVVFRDLFASHKPRQVEY